MACRLFLGCLLLMPVFVNVSFAARVNLCNVSQEEYNEYVSEEKIATQRYEENYWCDFDVEYVSGTSDNYCIYSGKELPVPYGFYLSTFYHKNNNCGDEVYHNTGEIRLYQGGGDQNICLVSGAFQKIPTGRILSEKSDYPNATCVGEIAVVKKAANGAIFCKPKPEHAATVTAGVPVGYALDTATSTKCPYNTVPRRLKQIGSSNTISGCLASYADVPAGFMPTQLVPEEQCSAGEQFFIMSKIQEAWDGVSVCSIKNDFYTPPGYVIKEKTGGGEVCGAWWNNSRYKVYKAEGSQINDVCPESAVPEGYARSGGTSIGCSITLKRISGSGSSGNCAQTNKDIPKGYLPVAIVPDSSICPLGYVEVVLDKVDSHVESVEWINNRLVPPGYVIIPSAVTCPLGHDCYKVSLPSKTGMEFCYRSSGVPYAIPAGYRRGDAITGGCQTTTDPVLEKFWLEFIPPPPPPTPVPSPGTFVNQETDISTAPAQPVIPDTVCPDAGC